MKLIVHVAFKTSLSQLPFQIFSQNMILTLQMMAVIEFTGNNGKFHCCSSASSHPDSLESISALQKPLKNRDAELLCAAFDNNTQTKAAVEWLENHFMLISDADSEYRRGCLLHILTNPEAVPPRHLNNIRPCLCV